MPFDTFGRPALEPLFAAALAGEPPSVPYSHMDMADDIIAVADALNAREVHLVGASLGGWLVRWAAVRHPERVRSQTVVMSGSGADRSDDAPQLEMEGLDELLTLSGRRNRDEHIDVMVEQWRRDWGSFEFNEPWIHDLVARSFDRAYRPDGMYRQLIAGFGSAGLWQAQGSIAAPTLVIHGTEDRVFPIEHGEATSAQIPDADMWRVNGMGHSMAPELWTEMVERIGTVAGH
jgi:pimeloyl-ACP methyl ester carboxylesterase